MVEYLRRALKRLEPPTCATCNVEMKWYRSLRPPGETTLIAHFFHCPNCAGIVQVTTPLRADDGGDAPPTRLARRARGRRGIFRSGLAHARVH